MPDNVQFDEATRSWSHIPTKQTSLLVRWIMKTGVTKDTAEYVLVGIAGMALVISFVILFNVFGSEPELEPLAEPKLTEQY